MLAKLARGALPVVLAALTALGLPGGAHGQQAATPATDITKMDYSPIGFYKPGDAIPPTSAAGTLSPNPSGKWVAYDTNIFESLSLPSRHPGDASASDPAGNGAQPYGFCPQGDPSFVPWGKCDDHQLEYLDYFERQMRQILGPFGVVIHRYPFHSPGTGSRGGYLDAADGQAYNVSATVPGAAHPDQSILVSGHYDFTDSGPAAGWDSQEGHAEVIRIAKIMADYWTATGTRPSVTVKFIPWDSEESGTWGSRAYVANNIPPGEEDKILGYFNLDPCAGAYPAFKNGNSAVRVPEVMQLADPGDYPAGPARDRILAFNARAETIVDEVLDHLDDTIQTPIGPQPIFVSNAEAQAGNDGKRPVGASQRGEVVTALGGLAIFSSDYANFAAIGVPILNLFPDYFGPHADGTPGHNDGIAILHTPNDNLTTINKLTSSDVTGLTASEGWAKGMEMCAHVMSWYMLQPEQGGAETANSDVVAYYEALPNEAIQSQAVTFDGSGSYQYSRAATHTFVRSTNLTYSWNFGDGTSATGKVVRHAYSQIGKYTSTLTVTGARGVSDTVTIPITVVGSNFVGPVLNPIDGRESADGTFPLSWSFSGTSSGFDHFSVQESSDFTTLLSDDAEGAISGNWTVDTPSDPRVEPWQASDSGARKLRGNQHRSGQRSFWTGVQPGNFNPSPTNVKSIMTLNNPITVPAAGDPQLSYWSNFQSEGDDQGRVEIALVDDLGNVGDFRAIDVNQATNTSAGSTDRDICDPTNPQTLQWPFENRTASLAAFKGKRILIRFNYALGPDNRVLSQPCGWYVDDIQVQNGTFTQIGTTTNTSFPVTGRPNGTYAYRVTGVYTDGVSTAPSNTETAHVTNAAAPDLVVVSVKASKDRSRADTLVLTATIANQGNGAGGASKTEFLLDGSTVLGVVDTAAIPAGGTTTVSVNWNVRGLKGTHTVLVTADKTTVVGESNETNNTRTLTVRLGG